MSCGLQFCFQFVHPHPGVVSVSVLISLSRCLATVCGVGFTPLTPGTAGSLVPCLSVLACRSQEPSAYWLFVATVVLSLLSLPSIRTVLEHPLKTRHPQRKKADPSYIVLDEVIGQLLTLGIVRLSAPLTVVTVALSFVFFRLLDITKPWPIRTVESALARRPPWQAVGIVVDDLMAGALAGILVLVGMLVFSSCWPGYGEIFSSAGS